jgi:tripartite-type tricarboxylate transporter receptor subunit TctC
MSSLSAALPHIESGKLRALGVTSAKRWPGSPDIATIAEQGYPSVLYLVWLGILAPKGTPPQIVTRLNREIADALSATDVRDQITAMGAAPVGGTPSEFESLLKADLEANEKIVVKTGLRLE